MSASPQSEQLLPFIFSLDGHADTRIFHDMSDRSIKVSPTTGNNKYQYMLDKLTDFITLCDSDYTIEEANRPAEVILGGGLTLKGAKCYEK